MKGFLKFFAKLSSTSYFRGMVDKHSCAFTLNGHECKCTCQGWIYRETEEAQPPSLYK